MSSEQTRDPVRDHLLTPQNSALIVIDYQPSQLRIVTSMDQELLTRNIASVARLAKLAKLYKLPVVLSTVNVVANNQPPTLTSSARCCLAQWRSTEPKSTHGRTSTSVEPSRQQDARS